MITVLVVDVAIPILFRMDPAADWRLLYNCHDSRNICNDPSVLLTQSCFSLRAHRASLVYKNELAVAEYSVTVTAGTTISKNIDSAEDVGVLGTLSY